jgi:hypothetical protein
MTIDGESKSLRARDGSFAKGFAWPVLSVWASGLQKPLPSSLLHVYIHLLLEYFRRDTEGRHVVLYWLFDLKQMTSRSIILIYAAKM